MPGLSFQNVPSKPSFKLCWSIVLTRAWSLLVALIFAVVLSVVSFMLLIPALITGYYYAVSQSRREEYFIDLVNVFRTTGLVFVGVKHYFLKSYLFFVVGIIPPTIALMWPMIPYLLYGEEHFKTTVIEYGVSYQILLIPAFFWLGSVVIYGYPWLVASKSTIAATQVTIKGIRRSPILVFVTGLVLLVPFTAIPFHILMPLSYPILVSWAITTILQEV